MESQDVSYKQDGFSMEKVDRFNTTSTTNLATSGSRNDLDAEELYDPFKCRNVEHPNTDLGAMVHLLKCSLGMGILAMSNAFKNGGLAFGLVGTVVVGVICTHCVNILVFSSHALCRRQKIPSLNFASTAEVAFQTGPKPLRSWSRFAKGFVNGALMATYYSSSVVYTVFISVSVKQVVDYHVPEEWHLNVRFYTLMFLVPLIGLALIRDLKGLVPVSAIANVCIIVGFAITLYYMFRDLPSIHDRELITYPSQYPLFFSTVVFAMEGIGVIMPVENSMKHPDHFLGCPGVLNISMTIVVAVYSVIGFFGYLKYGEETQGSITLNLPVEEILAQVVKLLVALAILCSYGLTVFIANQISWGVLEPHISEKWKSRAQLCFRLSIAVIVAGLAIAVPNLGPITSLVGAVCFSMLGLLVPAVIETVTFWNEGLGFARWRLYKNIIIIILSLIALVSGSYSSIEEIIETYGSV
ncbi:proton-coupled amino acid transporter-like protein pathetic [Anabrus simplex]|uniref:proton-coupled amino acid transporter-like protein pathetic n=1 Tax=Anabrus simplex TaxID=316456 RepID=UPI0035A33358